MNQAQPLGKRLRFVILTTSSIALLLAYMAFAISDMISFKESFLSNLGILADVTARDIVGPVSFDDSEQTYDVLASLRANRHIRRAIVFDLDNQVLASLEQDWDATGMPEEISAPSQVTSDGFVVITRSILGQTEKVGTLLVIADTDEATERLVKFSIIGLAILLVSLIVSLIISRRLRRSITRPILKLADLTQRVSVTHDFSLRADPTPLLEVNQLVSGFNEMLEEIQTRDTALRESQQRLSLALEGSGEALWDLNLESGEFYLDRRGQRMMGIQNPNRSYTLSEILQRVERPDRVKAKRAMTAHIEGETNYFHFHWRVRTIGGPTVWLMVHGKVVEENDEGEPIRLAGTQRDVTEQKHAEEKLSFLANFDALTGLPNRSLFHDRLEHAAAVNSRGGSLAVLFIDLDRFKRVNDSLGHAVGDTLLKETARRLEESVRKKDTVARLSGDEFAVLMEGVQNKQQELIIVATRILRMLRKRFFLADNEIRIGASIGISIYPDDSEELDDLLQNADRAMYASKQKGRNRFEFYDAEMNLQALHRLKLENQLHKALEQGEFRLFYQPKVDTQTGELQGAEALIRWQHPELGILPPGEFIPLAEESGLITPIGQWVIEEACRQLTLWAKAGFSEINVAVNLSTRQFENSDLPRFVGQTLRKFGTRGGSLGLEITEGIVMEDPDRVLVELGALKSLGVEIAIDDFGTGYSSLSYLKLFPLDTLKVDRAFVEGIANNQSDAKLTAAIITMAHGLGLTVVAEGVETMDQLRLLQKLGCEQVQGFLFSRAIPAEEFEKLLRKGEPLQPLSNASEKALA